MLFYVLPGKPEREINYFRGIFTQRVMSFLTAYGRFRCTIPFFVVGRVNSKRYRGLEKKLDVFLSQKNSVSRSHSNYLENQFLTAGISWEIRNFFLSSWGSTRDVCVFRVKKPRHTNAIRKQIRTEKLQGPRQEKKNGSLGTKNIPVNIF